MAKREGVARDVYLGGLGDRPASAHMRSRHRTAEILAELGPPLTYFRAGMIVGEESQSYRTLRYLVQRLSAMIGPAWLKTPTQAIAIDDVIAYLVAAPDVPAAAGREVQIAGPDVLSYGEMLDRMADALGVRRRPRVPVPFITPWLSSLWIGLVTPVDAGVARPLVEGLSTPTTVTDSAGAELFDVHPMPFMDALRKALDEDHRAPQPCQLERCATGGVGSIASARLSSSPCGSLTSSIVSMAPRGVTRIIPATTSSVAMNPAIASRTSRSVIVPARRPSRSPRPRGSMAPTAPRTDLHLRGR